MIELEDLDQIQQGVQYIYVQWLNYDTRSMVY